MTTVLEITPKHRNNEANRDRQGQNRKGWDDVKQRNRDLNVRREQIKERKTKAQPTVVLPDCTGPHARERYRGVLTSRVVLWLEMPRLLPSTQLHERARAGLSQLPPGLGRAMTLLCPLAHLFSNEPTAIRRLPFSVCNSPSFPLHPPPPHFSFAFSTSLSLLSLEEQSKPEKPRKSKPLAYILLLPWNLLPPTNEFPPTLPPPNTDISYPLCLSTWWSQTSRMDQWEMQTSGERASEVGMRSCNPGPVSCFH